MLYKPNFCCQCGEKVDRFEWRLWTSRRFCENCEKDFRNEDWIPRVGLLFAAIGGLFGFGSFLKTPEKPLNVTSNQFSVSSPNKAQTVKNESNLANIKSQNIAQNQPIVSNSTLQASLNNQSFVNNNPQISNRTTLKDNLQNAAEEAVYFCGAQTKKGTSCTRKVKGGGRCWQHTGLPAMLPKEKLATSQ